MGHQKGFENMSRNQLALFDSCDLLYKIKEYLRISEITYVNLARSTRIWLRKIQIFWPFESQNLSNKPADILKPNLCMSVSFSRTVSICPVYPAYIKKLDCFN